MPPLPRVFTTPLEVRQACRANQLDQYASQALGGYLCVNVVLMAASDADEFRAFCTANPDSCPLLATLAPGETAAPDFAEKLDIRTDLRSYDVIEYGEIRASVTDIIPLFRADTVTFLLGSSVSLDGYLIQRGMGPTWGPCIYLSERRCRPVGRFQGPVAVTMRAYSPTLSDAVSELSAHFPACHGGPIAKNDPLSLGIFDERHPYFPWNSGVFPGVHEDKLYWPCGITPSLVAREAKLPLMIVHSPGNALITDIPTEKLYDRFDLVAGLSAYPNRSR